MKKLLFAIAATLLAASVQAAPFAYVDGPNGTTLFYHQKCPAADSTKWQFGVLVFDNGNHQDGCWLKYQSTVYKDEIVQLCAIGKNEQGKLVRGNACITGSAAAVIKGNPIPPRAF